MEKDINVPYKVIKLFDEILDYAMTVQGVTGYKCPDEPDFLTACRFIGKIKEDKRRGECKGENRNRFEKTDKND